MDLALGALLFALGILPLLRWTAKQHGAASALSSASLAILFAGTCAFVLRPTGVPEHEVLDRPIEVVNAEDSSSNPCRACHPSQYGSWHSSYHRTMTQVPSPESVKADWNQRLQAAWTSPDGSTERRGYELLRQGEEFWVRSQDPVFASKSGGFEPGARRIALVTGSHHEQFFWYATGDQRKLAQFPLGFSLRQRRWLPMQALLLSPPRPPGDLVAGWNLICVRCHSTHGRPRLEGGGNGPFASSLMSRVDTQVTEFGIACESCHGAAREHVETSQNPLRRYALHVGMTEESGIVNPAELDSKRSADICGSCHSMHHLGFGSDEDIRQFNREGFAFRPGDVLRDQRLIATWEHRDDPAFAEILAIEPEFFTNRFWPDGMPAINGREYNSLLQTPCYERGELTCTSCHSMHRASDDPRPVSEWADDQLDHEKLGNEACLSCHEDFRTSLEEHTQHLPGSAGSLCYNCHMPNTTYGLLKQTRSHQVDVPDVATALETGRPTACNLCHVDRPLAWTASELKSSWGRESPMLEDPDHRRVSYAALQALRGDAGLRAMAAWHMGWPPALEASGAEWMVPILAVLLEDPYAAVRHLAAESLRSRPGFEDFEYDYIAPRPALEAGRREALARWQRNQRLVLARDRIGIKPLYYYLDDDKLLFGSEIKAILEDKSIERELNTEALDLYLSYMYVPAPFSMIKGIQKLSAGHVLVHEQGQTEIKQYWDLTFEQDSSRTFGDYKDEFLSLFEDSVKKRMNSEVELGAFLSGGVDSSAIVAMMSQLSDKPIKTFSIGFRGRDHHDESEYAQLIADQFQTEHHSFDVDGKIFDLMDKYIEHFDEPFADYAAFPTYVLSKMAREHVTVCLTGDGCDEIFAGYERYWSESVARSYRSVPGFIRNRMLLPAFGWSKNRAPKHGRLYDFFNGAEKKTRLMGLPDDERYISSFFNFDDKQKGELFSDQGLLKKDFAMQTYLKYWDNNSTDYLSRRLYLDIKTSLAEDMMTKVDRVTMANGLEARVPFLDHRLVEFSAKVPADMKMDLLNLKKFVRRSFKGILPEKILNRPKHGFSSPIDRWFREELKDKRDDVLCVDSIKRAGIFNSDYVERMKKDHDDERANYGKELFMLMVYQMWQDRYKIKQGALV